MACLRTSAAGIKLLGQEQLEEEEKVCLTSQVTVCPGNQSRNPEARTEAEALEECHLVSQLGSPTAEPAHLPVTPPTEGRPSHLGHY